MNKETIKLLQELTDLHRKNFMKKNPDTHNEVLERFIKKKTKKDTEEVMLESIESDAIRLFKDTEQAKLAVAVATGMIIYENAKRAESNHINKD